MCFILLLLSSSHLWRSSSILLSLWRRRALILLLILLLELLFTLLREHGIECELECIIHHSGQQHLQISIALFHTRIRIDLNEPHFEVLIHHEVIPEYFEAVGAIIAVQLLAYR